MKKKIIIEDWKKTIQNFNRLLGNLNAPVNMINNSVTPDCPVFA